MKKRNAMPMPITGGSSLLVIFAVLCLTVFALLALSTVQANGRLSQTTAQSVTDYYEADCQAEEIFAQLRQGEVPLEVTVSGSVYAYTCAISENQDLQVEVERTETGWKVLRWQAVSVTQWSEEDRPMEVWDGE